MWIRSISPLYDVEGGGGSVTEVNKDTILDTLNEETVEETPDEIVIEDDEEDPKEEDEEIPENLEDELEEELKEEDEDIDDDKLELVTPVKRREILAKYPNLFKDFPYLETAYYREQRYSEILPTIEDAERAVERSTLLNKYGRDLIEGDSRNILKDTKEANEGAFYKLVDNYLPNLYAVDQNAYYHVVGNTVKDVIRLMVETGREQNNQELIESAKILNKFTFNTDKYVPPQRLSKAEEKNEKEEELRRREQEFEERRLNEVVDSLESKVSNTLKSTLDKNLDPRDTMDPYVKSKAAEDALNYLNQAIESDTRFQNIITRLFQNAAKDNYSAESVNKVKSAYLSKAKSLLPEVIKKVRREAMGKGSKFTPETKKAPLPVGKTRSAATLSSGKSDSDRAKAIPRGVSTLDFLNKD